MDVQARSQPQALRVVLRHLIFEDLGVFDRELQRCGLTVEYRQAGVEPLSASDWQDADLVMVPADLDPHHKPVPGMDIID